MAQPTAMRILHTLAFIASTIFASAQTVNTVQNGNWDAPSTWSCNCVPAPSSSLVIMHSVQLLGDLNMLYPQVQVTNTGEIMTTFPVNVINDGNFIMEGHVFFQGSFINLALVDITGFFEVAGVFHTDGNLVMDGGVLQVEGNFINLASVDGTGSICVIDSTTNEGDISGTVDICDASPTVFTAPFVDENTGTIAGTVTYCSNSACATGIMDGLLARITFGPNPADDRVQLGGLLAGASYVIIDATGRTCALGSISSDRAEVDVTALVSGAYRLQVRTADGSRTLPFLIVR
ncbi:MAG: T9SS type A sorting domain-containing protein [Flavobacteriales bacterium]|nr:T9SS type A sorting domain-containing protein [Flavobacteriales bacterium]